MKTLGIIIILMWVSLAPVLYPFPPQLVEQYKSFIAEETDIYVQTLSEEAKAEYISNSDSFLESELNSKKVVIWIKWGLQLSLIILGMLAGWFLYNKKRFRYIAVPTSVIYLMICASQLSRSLPAWGPPWLEAYIEFLSRASFTESIIADFFFYNQYLILPVLHTALLAGCVFWKNKQVSST